MFPPTRSFGGDSIQGSLLRVASEGRQTSWQYTVVIVVGSFASVTVKLSARLPDGQAVEITVLPVHHVPSTPDPETAPDPDLAPVTV